MKLFYAIILGLIVLVSACAQQASTGQTVQPTQPEVQPVKEPVEETPEVVEEIAEEAPTANEVRVLGQGAFEPNELTINAGDSVTWVNTDEKEAVIIIFKDGKAYQNSQKLKPGESFEHEFKEPGSYQYWRNIAFSGDGARITVE